MAMVKKMISMDQGIARELEGVAKALGKTQREVVESALDFYFDYTDGIVADRITEQVRNGQMATYDADEVRQKLGLDR
jgi:predicted DNA-binding protein